MFVSFVTNIFHETVTASAIDKKLADIFKSSTGVGSIMDLCPFSKFSLAIDTDLHEKILHQVFDSIDVLIIDELHSFLTDFFNSDHGPEGWDIAVESLHVSNTEHEIIGKTKKLLKPTLVHFFKAFSLNALNPLRNLETLEKPYLNRFVHPIIDAALWIFGRTNYIYGEIPLQTEKSCIPAFAGMGYFSLYLAGKLHVFDRKGYTYKSFVVVTPLVIAILICISRTQDYRHHWQDVFAGSTLGFILAIFSYYQYYPSIHSPVCDKPYSVRLKKKVPGRSAEFEFADGSNFTVKITREDGGLVYQDNRALLSYDADSLDNISKASSSSNLHDSTKKNNNEQNSLFESLNQKYCGKTQCKFLFLYSNINNYSNRDSLTNPNKNTNLLKFFINLAKSLEYTIVLPNVGFSDGNDDDNNNLGGQLRIDACQKYPFDFYYDVDNLESKFLEAQFISQSNFSNWLIERNEIIHNNFNGNDDKKRKDLELKVEHLNLNLRLNQETEELLISFEEPLVEYVQNEIMIQGCLEQFNNNNNNSERGRGAFNLTRLYLLDKM
ncbi:16122_t:CDS:2, partial [Entrophospora sp. SA101]